MAVAEVADSAVDSEVEEAASKEEEAASRVKRTSEAVEEAQEVVVVPESPVVVLLRMARPPRLLLPRPLRLLTEHFEVAIRCC